MIIEKLRVKGFRNLLPSTIDFCGGIDVLTGENAQGKTNILEAVHLLSTLTSFRTRKVREMMGRGEEKVILEGDLKDRDGSSNLRVEMEKEGKRAWIDGNTPTSTAQYLKVLPSVFFGPGDMRLTGGDQLLRRRFLDRAAFDLSSLHFDILKDYKRVLSQRNSLISQGKKDIEHWSVTLAEKGWKLFSARKKALEELAGRITTIHYEISGGLEEIRFILKPSWDENCGEDGLCKALEESIDDDISRGFTHHGPHRDRLKVLLDGRDINEHGSQGQHRTLALSMKLSLLLWAEERGADIPLFLLDDPGSELDERRMNFLAEFFENWHGQVMIATVKSGEIPLKGNKKNRFHRVERGSVNH
ncbi:MAG: hypothetical protein C0608_10625 [Deltaproteobacteria bacterium]|nr:MAG: hypothetical protein C0608_10625 [Deltaproteobacteria bacterium]